MNSIGGKSLGELPLFRALREAQETQTKGNSLASRNQRSNDAYNPFNDATSSHDVRQNSGITSSSSMHILKSYGVNHIRSKGQSRTKSGLLDHLSLAIMEENTRRDELHTLGHGIFKPIGLSMRDRKPTVLESKKTAIVDSIYNTIWNNTNASRNDNMAASQLTAGPSPFLLQGCVSYSHMDMNDENVGGGPSSGTTGHFQFHESFQASNIDNTNILGLSIQDARADPGPQGLSEEEEAEDAFYDEESWEENAMYME